MPTYQYACTECGHDFETVQSFSDDALTAARVCGGRLRKVFNSVGIVFKGSGFYRNDSREKAKSGAGSASEVRLRLEVRREGRPEARCQAGRQDRRRASPSPPRSRATPRPSGRGRERIEARPFVHRRAAPPDGCAPRVVRATRSISSPDADARARRTTTVPAGRDRRHRRARGSTRSSSRRRPSRSPTPWGDAQRRADHRQVAGRSVAFLPRHGRDHRFPPHRVNYRANLWALRAVGVRQVLAPCAVGSLKAEHDAGSVVVPDQVVDRTWGRASTFYDEPGVVVHVPVRRPLLPDRAGGCRRGRPRPRAGDPVDGGTLVVVNGPRFSSRAESLWHQAQGWTDRRHDRDAGGGAGPRARPVLHHRRPGHRPRRRPRARRGRDPRGGAARLRVQHREGPGRCCSTSSPRCPPPTPTASAGTRWTG